MLWCVTLGSVIVPTASGHGSLTLGGTFTITELYGQLVTPGSQVHIYGYSPVRRVFNAGWYGVATDPGGTYPDIVFFGKFLEYEADDYRFPTSSTVTVNRLWWDLTPGTVLFLEVDW